jgi:predicted O-methyltransferase YrrM
MGFQRSRILLTGFELGVFTAVGQGRAGSAEVADRIGTDPRATDRLMNALVATGFLDKQDGLFANTEEGRRFLVQGSPGYLAGLGHSNRLFQAWSTLTEAVRAGTAVAATPFEDRSEAQFEPFIAAMHERAKDSADELVGLLDLAGVDRVLDVGGGSGVYAMAFARAGERAGRRTRAVVLDLPPVAAIARRYIAGAGLADRVTAVAGDYLKDDFGAGFDLVFLSAIVHINSPEENRDLAARACAALNPGGRVAIQDFVMDQERTEPAFGAVFALNMLVNTTRGDTYTEAEIAAWLREAGCAEVVRIDSGPATSLVVGRKAR